MVAGDVDDLRTVYQGRYIDAVQQVGMEPEQYDHLVASVKGAEVRKHLLPVDAVGRYRVVAAERGGIEHDVTTGTNAILLSYLLAHQCVLLGAEEDVVARYAALKDFAIVPELLSQ